MEAAIFDIDGTLTETNEIDNSCFIEAIQAVLSLPKVDDDWTKYTHVTDQCIVDEIYQREHGEDLSHEKSRVLEEHFLSLLAAQPNTCYPELPGAAAFIKLLQDRQIPIAIATGCWRCSAEFKLRQAKIDYSEIPMGTSSEAVSREAIMLHAHDALLAKFQRASFDRVIYFGDATWDVHATAKLGWDLIGIGQRIEMLRELKVQHTFPDYSAADEILAASGLTLQA